MESSKEAKRQHPETFVPIEIVGQIVEHLPLRSLARFKCTSKLWLALIDEVIGRRARFRLSRVTEKLGDMHSALFALFDEMNEFFNHSYNAHVIIGVGEQLKQKQDEMLGLLASRGDGVDRYVDGIDQLGDDIANFVRQIDGCRIRYTNYVAYAHVLPG